MSFEELKSAYSRYLGRCEFILLEMSHPEWDKTWYFVNNNVPLTIDGEEYTGLPFKFVLNTQGETTGSSLSISNVDNRLISYLKQAITNDDLKIKVWTCHYENSEAYETEYKGEFLGSSPSVTLEQIDISLNLRLSLDYNLGTIRYNKTKFPNIYRG